jgi:hypothetical protein
MMRPADQSLLGRSSRQKAPSRVLQQLRPLIRSWSTQRDRYGDDCDRERSAQEPPLTKSEYARHQYEYANYSGFPERAGEIQQRGK